MATETRINVPVNAMDWLIPALTEAGLTVMDTGERVTTEEQVGGEAVLCVARFGGPEGEVSIREPPMQD